MPRAEPHLPQVSGQSLRRPVTTTPCRGGGGGGGGEGGWGGSGTAVVTPTAWVIPIHYTAA